MKEFFFVGDLWPDGFQIDSIWETLEEARAARDSFRTVNKTSISIWKFNLGPFDPTEIE